MEERTLHDRLVEIQSSLKAALDKRSFRTRTGDEMQVQEFVLTYMDEGGKWANDLCLEAKGDDIRKLSLLKPNDMLRVTFTPSSREYNGRWFTSCRVSALSSNKLVGQEVNTDDLPGDL